MHCKASSFPRPALMLSDDSGILEKSSMRDNNKTQGIHARFLLHLAVLQQSYRRLGIGDTPAFSHYARTRRVNKDVTFYEERIPPEWRKGRENGPTGKNLCWDH